MSDSNTTNLFNPSTFILLGIPGLEREHVWISIPFCIMYIIAILGNFIMIFIVKIEPSLHTPMYYFLCMLAITDLTGLGMVLRGAILALPYPFLVKRCPYYRTNIIPQPYCEHITMVKLACTDLSISSYYGLFVVFAAMGLDMFLTAVSYTQILRAIFSLPTKDTRLKTFGTCSSHLFSILTFYLTSLFSALIHRFGQSVPRHSQVLIASVCALLAPMLNPVIYGVRTKQMQGKLLQLIGHRRV
ncbi:olfactory receptor 52B2-like [Pelodiscus sinensis]|uniref:olfactory receptor 52B2-like n=1 Tax=Pelodiscus sinensis TaxID=13735 RepID=UPI003F6C027B